MRIEIRRSQNGVNTRVVIVSFDTRGEQFESPSERNRFFRGLNGWEQVVPHGNKVYRYQRPGLLDEVPHARISDSAFMVAQEQMQRVMEYFRHWQKKVEYDMMEVMMEQQAWLRSCRKNSVEKSEEDEQAK